MLPPATVRFNNAVSASELAPRAIIDAGDIAIINAGVSAWWPGEAGMMEGVAQGSTLPFRWKSNTDLQALTPAVQGKPPLLGFDATIKKNFLQLGYGGALARRTNNLAALRLKAGGTGHVVGDVLTLTGGAQVTITAVTSGAITATGFNLTGVGAYSAQPTTALAQTASSGAGTGATFVPEFATNDGSLALSPAPALIPPAAPFTIVSVFRCPVVGGVAGADPGGFIFGAQLGQSELYDTTANTRWWGLRVGGPAQYGAGKLIGHLNGDNLTLLSPGAIDYRDGQWHVAMLTFNPGLGAGSASLWIDGVQVATSATLASISYSAAVPSGLLLRVGAAGLPSTGPAGGAALDVGEVLIAPSDLNLAANASARQAVLNRLLTVWRQGGASN